jgi:HAMP domain-containing protein
MIRNERFVGPLEENGVSDEPARSIVKRERYLIEARSQFALALPLVAIPLVVALAYALAIYLLPGEVALSAMTPEEARRISFHASLLYLAFATVAMAAAAVFLTHRFVGPARVIERAIREMSAGKYDQRVSLRPRDHLQSLASALMDLRDQLRERDERRRQLVRELASRLDEEDVKGARDLLIQLALPVQRATPPGGETDA